MRQHPIDEFPGGPGGLGRFIGREREIGELHAAFAEAVAGRGSICMLAGEPGIGKSRTAQELAIYAERQGVEVLWGRCYESGGAPPYWPWVQALRAYAETHESDELRTQLGSRGEVIAEIVPELRAKLPELRQTETVQDPAARFRLFDSVGGFLREATREKPLVLIIDNLHAADKPSLLLLEFLAHEIRQLHLIVVATYRDVELTLAHPLTETLGELARESGTGGFRTIRLRGLAAEEVDAFIVGVSGAEAPVELVNLVHAQTEGNPLFVIEVARLLLDEGLIGQRATSLASPVPRSIRIPEGVKQVIGRRLNRLSPECLRILTVGSVIGREFAHAELQRLLRDESADWLLAGLDEAIAARLIEDAPADRNGYQFTHVLIRETLYDELGGPRRALLHGRAGEALEELYAADLDSQLPRLAHHFSEAARGGEVEKGIDYSIRGGERATRMLAYEEATRYYETAYELLALHTKSSERQCQILMAWAEALARAGEYPRARQTFDRAAAVAREIGSHEFLARAALGVEYASWRPGFHGAAAALLLQEALDAIPVASSPLRAQLLGALARALTFSGRWEDGVRVVREALDMAHATGDWRTLAQIMQGRTESFFVPSIAQEMSLLGEEILEMAQKQGDDEVVLEMGWTISTHLVVGDKSNGVRHLDAIERVARKQQQPFYLYNTLCSRTTFALMEGKFAEAEAFISEALATAERFKGIDAMGIYGIQMFTLRWSQGRLREIEPALRMFVRGRDVSAIWGPGLALIYAELGMREEAREQFELLAESGFAGLPRDALWNVCLAYLARVCAFLGDRERSVQLSAFLEPSDGYCIILGGSIAFCGAAARYIGMLAAVREEWADAERHFQDALELEKKAGAPACMAETEVEYSAMLLARGRSSDRERARDLLRSAAAAAERMGMQGVVERAQALLVQVESPDRPTTRSVAGYGDLTDRELEVLRLIAAGKTNQEIASELVISPNTAAHHVASIISKIGAPNRTAAAAYALSRGLA